VGKVRALFALHGIDQHLVKECQLFVIRLGIEFDALGQEVLGYDLLQLGGVILW
jgi:hypothetical protein